MKSLPAIARELNATASSYRMREFQQIRRQIHRLSRSSTNKIFTDQTIHENWAFHYGGRKEIQFNIGFEGEHNEYFRYGLAFSLEASQTLPIPLVLKPKVQKLNEYIRENLAELEDIRFWYYRDRKRSTIRPVEPIVEDLIRNGTFLFWGKLCLRDEVRPEEVLFLFDRLLDVYEFVEGSAPLSPRPAALQEGFRFRPGIGDKMETTVQLSRATVRAVMLAHNNIQKSLYTLLCEKFGADNIGTENDTGRGSRVDLVMRNKNEYVYYEIKTNPNIKDCLREAISQLVEYSYWPGGHEAKALVVVSDNPLTPDARRYVSMLRNRFQLPIYYQYLDMERGTLGIRE